MASAILPDEAIVIGIGRYPQLGPKLTPMPLEGPVLDATEMAEWLAARGSHVKMLTSDGDGQQNWTVTDLRPEFADVERPLNMMAIEVAKRRARGELARLGRRLTIYMAGHGFVPRSKHLALITAEAADGVVTSIEATSWADWISAQRHFDEVVLIMDCCAVSEYSLPSRGPIGELKLSSRGPAKVVTIWAAGPTQVAYEGSVDGGPVRGLFTAELLKALGGAAAENGVVTTSTLRRYFEGGQRSDGAGAAQPRTKPSITPYFRDDDELEFARIGILPEYRIHTGWPAGAPVTILWNAKEKVFEGPVGADGVVAAQLGFGLYALRDSRSEKLFNIAAGGGLDVYL